MQNPLRAEICPSCSSKQHMPACCWRKWIFCSITEHPLRFISSVHPLRGALENSGKINLGANLFHFWAKRKVSRGCYCSWSDSPPGISYPWKLLHLRDCRADNDELYDSSCHLPWHLSSRMLLLPVRLNFSDFITQLLALVSFLIARLKILI